MYQKVDEINKAKSCGLQAMYYQDNYVYLVDKDGDPLDWHGFNGKANKGVKEPYIVCTIHTEEAYKEFMEEKERLEKEEQERLEQEEQEKQEQENGGTVPEEPESTQPPAEPTSPAEPTGD